MKLKKWEYTANYLQTFEKVFRCPYCHHEMYFDAPRSLVCVHQHRFDISKKGTLCFVKKVPKTDYSETLFSARRTCIESGMYDLLLQKISEYIPSKETGWFVDAGCGEGSFTHQMAKWHDTYSYFAMDLSKSGITLATSLSIPGIWAMADLTNIPLQDHTVSVILNILSPAMYDEFSRILSSQGVVIKVFPAQYYLTELRQHIFPDQPNRWQHHQDHSRDMFSKMYNHTQWERITYQWDVASECSEALWQMSPLSWNHSLQKAPQISKITVDLWIGIGSNAK